MPRLSLLLLLGLALAPAAWAQSDTDDQLDLIVQIEPFAHVVSLDDQDGAADCDDDDCVAAADCAAPGEPTFVRGDTNSDGSINLTDGVVPLLYLFSGGAAPVCLDAADTNDTGSVEITDAIIVFSWLFSGGAAPASPSPLSPGYSSEECAVDPTDDGIGCDRPSPVCN